MPDFFKVKLACQYYEDGVGIDQCVHVADGNPQFLPVILNNLDVKAVLSLSDCRYRWDFSALYCADIQHNHPVSRVRHQSQGVTGAGAEPKAQSVASWHNRHHDYGQCNQGGGP